MLGPTESRTHNCGGSFATGSSSAWRRASSGFRRRPGRGTSGCSPRASTVAPMCVASHRTAAALHGFDGFSPGIIEVLVPMNVRHRRRDVIVHHTRDLPPQRHLQGRTDTGDDTGTDACSTLGISCYRGRRRGGIRRSRAGREGATRPRSTSATRRCGPGRTGIGAMTRHPGSGGSPSSGFRGRCSNAVCEASACSVRAYRCPSRRYWVRTANGRVLRARLRLCGRTAGHRGRRAWRPRDAPPACE